MAKLEALTSTPKSWNPLSWIIRLLTDAKESHSALCFLDKIHHMLEDTSDVVYDQEKFYKENKVIVKWRYKKDVSESVLKDMAALLENREYGWKELIGFILWVLPWRAFGIVKKNPFQDSNTLFCVEYCFKACAMVDPYFNQYKNSSNIHPKDMRKIFDTAPDWERVSD